MKYLATLLATLLFLPLYGETPKPSCDFTPLFYGTLLELPTTNNDPGELTLQPYLYGGACFGVFDNNWNLQSGGFGSLNPQLLVYLGLTKHLQIFAEIGSQTIWYHGHSSSDFSDSFLGLGWQFLWDQKGKATPNLILNSVVLFPTGTYQRLGTKFNGFNASGFGSYAAGLGLVIDKTFYSNPCHPLNLALDFGYVYPFKTSLHGINTYGGAENTRGTYHLGGRAFVFLAAEYYINSSLTFSLDVQYQHGFTPTFTGFAGSYPTGEPALILTKSDDELVVSPAIELGFTPQMALYIGGFFTVAGRNVAAYAQGVLSFLISF